MSGARTRHASGQEWIMVRCPDDRPGDTDRHYGTATPHGELHAIGDTRRPVWQWRLVSGGRVIARGSVHRYKEEPLENVLGTMTRTARVAARFAS